MGNLFFWSFISMMLVGNFESKTSSDLLCKSIKKIISNDSWKKVGDKKMKVICDSIISASKRWKMNPYVIAGVIYAEATFRPNPPAGKICRKQFVFYDKPGPQPRGYPKLVKKCRWVGKVETGIMQVIPYERIAKRCYRLVTGKTVKWRCGKNKNCRSYRNYKKDLRDVRINIPVAVCDIRTKCDRCKRRHGKSHSVQLGWKTPLVVRKFFKRKRHLMKHFCVSHYNWGGVYRPKGSIYVNKWRYPIKVLGFANKIYKAAKLIKEEAFTQNIKSVIIDIKRSTTSTIGIKQ